VEKFRDLLLKRGSKGIVGLKRQFTLMDQDNSGALDPHEFANAIKDYRMAVENVEIDRLFELFDFNKDRTIDFGEFLKIIIGSMSEKRIGLIGRTFQKLDKNRNGVLDVDEIKSQFDPSRHPLVKSGEKTEDDVLTDFIDLFDSHHNVIKNFKVTKDVQWEEFVEFYTAISSTISNDKEFEILITCVWSLDLANTNKEPIAGKKNAIDLKDSKAAFKYDMHRSLFGKLDNSPYKHQK
jgi:Ca2+-binding EF-hand superfamily protein